jgi:integrase/recombinase XerD
MKWKQALQDYTHYLKIERGLSENSIKNYTLDVQKLTTFLTASNSKECPISISKETIQKFIYEVAKIINPRSQARIISGLKGFFNYLVFEDYRKENPMDLIESPKIGRKLPDTLSTDEINNLISAIDLSKPEGERNRAIIETLYGCGLRVSELTNLRLSDLYFEEEFIKVTGKGDKQRFVPISKVNIKYINLYRKEVRVHQKIEDLRSIQQMLGHESITTTEVYMHVNRTHLAKVLSEFHPRK